MPSTSEKRTRLAFLHEVLAPLTELAAILGLSVAEAEQALRYQFVRGALRRLTKERNRRITFSDVAVITGLDRKQVTRLLSADEPRFPADQFAAHRAERVLSAWFEDTDFRKPDGKPRDLQMEGPLSFPALVGRYAGDVPPKSVLDELVLREAARLQTNGEVRALRRSLGTSRFDPEALEQAGRQIAKLLRAMAHNLSVADANEQMFIRDIVVTGLAPEDLAIARRDARSFLEPALDTVVHSKRRRYSRAGKAPPDSGTLSAIVCITTAAPSEPAADKRPQQHRKRRKKTQA